MKIDYEILPEILLYFTAFFAVYYVLYRRFIFSIIDPLFIFIFTTSFASVLVIEVLDEFSSIIHFFLCQLSLWLGFSLVQDKVSHLLRPHSSSSFSFNNTRVLEITVYILLGVYILGNLIVFFTKGFALLSDTPSDSKVSNFQGGFGIFRKINWAAGGFVTAGLIYLYLIRSRNIHIVLLLIVAFFTALEGSKGSLLRLLTTFAFLAYHPMFKNRKEILMSFKKYVPIGFSALLIVFFTVLLKENDDPEQAIFAFLRRFLYSGDSILYYYTPVNINYFSRYSFTDYPAYLFNTILGFLRLGTYKEAFGNVMVENALPDFAKADVIVGPNTPFYIEGKIFFGYYGAFIHSFIIGAIYATVRNIYFSLVRSSSFLIVFLCCICHLSSTIITDTSLFMTIFFDTCFFVIPTYVISCFIVDKKLIIRWPKFSFNK